MSEVESQPFEEQRQLAEKALESRHWPRHVCEQIASAFLGLLEAYALAQKQIKEMDEEAAQYESEKASRQETINTLYKQKIEEFKRGREAGESERAKIAGENQNLNIEIIGLNQTILEIQEQLEQRRKKLEEKSLKLAQAQKLLKMWFDRWMAEIAGTPKSLKDQTVELLQLDNK